MARLALSSGPILVLLTISISVISAGPTGQASNQKCVSFCGGGKNFDYEPGITYVYEYTSDIETSVVHTAQQRSHVRLTARAEIEALSACDLKLQLKNVEFEDLTITQSQDESLSFSEEKNQLEQYPMVFGLQDGKIEEICTNTGDDIWVLNVKRGLVSMLQNTMDDLSTSGVTHETDINGRCPTEYIVEGSSWGGGHSYKKIKDLTKCTLRQTELSAIQSVPYSSSSPVQNIPLLNGRLECMQTIRNKRMEKVHCKEEQLFQPFEDRNSGATTTILQTLDYVSETRAQRQTDTSTYVKKTLLFESTDEKGKGRENGKQVLELLEFLDVASFPEVTPNAPKLFSSFVQLLKDSSEASIRQVYESVVGSRKEKYLMEAMPLIGSAGSLGFLRDLTVEGVLTQEKAVSWLSALAFIKHPSMDMIKAVAPIILNNEPSMEALLGISALINSYCKYNPSCNQEVGVNEILEKMTTQLGPSCHVDSSRVESVRKMVLQLKAIGNTGVLPITEEVSKTPVVMKCLEDKQNPTEVRLAAIDSLRRLPCGLCDNDKIVELFGNVEENTEVRIKAFLTIMKCANRHTVELVKTMLYTESVNQVASFVWTFLTNLQETNRPEKQEIRDLVSNEFLKNKFSTDARKFSRNYEAATYNEEWNIGGGLDSNIIFTEESFLPKSGMLNLTVQLFGESINLLEFGVRAHGLEQVLERVFGPQGFFPDNRVTEFLDSTRVKRDLSRQEMDGLGYLYDQAKPDIEQVPGGSFYTRIFGHEVIYKNFDISEKTPIPSVVDETGQSWFNIRHILNNLSTGKSSEFSRSSVLLDTSYSIATSSGFPLNLGIHAVATMSLVAKGKFNVGKLMESKELDIHGTLKPSTMINVDGTLMIKIGRNEKGLKTGLKLHNTLRSSTAVELNLLLKGKNLLHASLNFPKDKHELIDVSSQLIIVGTKGQLPVDDEDRDESNELVHISNGCSGDYVSEAFGMKLCTEMNIPYAMSFTPKRPSFLRIYMEKVDDFKGYTVDYRFNSDASTTQLSMVFDTPDSIINRRMAADFLLDRGMGKLAASLESVSTALRAEAVYTQFQKNFELSLASNEKTSFLFSTGIRSDGNVMKPHLLVTWHSRPLVDLKGTIDTTPQANNDEKIAVEVNLKHLTETPVKIVGDVTGSNSLKEATFSIESYILTGTIRSQLKRKVGHWSTKTSVDYSWKRGKVQTADLSAKVQQTRKGTLAKYVATAGLSSSQFPNSTIDFLWETQGSSGFCENTMKIGWGKTTWEGHTLYSRQNQFDHSELRFEASLGSPRFEIDYKLEFAHRANTEGFKTKFLSRVGSGYELNANVEYVSSVDDLLKKSLEAGASWPNSEYSFKALFFEKQRGDFETEMVVNLNNTRELKATALYLNRSNNLRLDHTIEFRARGFTSVPFSGSVGLSATEKQTHIGCQVQFEGKKPYSSRMSTSLDYSHTKFSHKFEGKVTLNEKKYNGELFYGTSKTGAKNVTLDLQLESHIFVEATLNGMLPEPMLASLLVIPDKNNEAGKKVQIDANVDPNSLSLATHYFGEEVGFAARYDEESILVEAIWPQDKKVVISAIIPKLSLSEAQVEIEVLTPFEGYKNVTFIGQHKFDGEKLKTTGLAGVEDSQGELNLSGMFSSKEISISSDLTVTDYPKYEASFLLLRKSKRKSFQISMRNGDRQSLLDFDFIRLDEGYMGKFDFFGCPFLHKISMEINHQFSEAQTCSYNTKVGWAEKEQDEMKEIALLVKIQKDPLTIESVFNSPWNGLNEVTASLTWDPDTVNRQLAITAKKKDGEISSNLKILLVGSLADFKNEIDGEWYGKTARLTVSGGFDGFVNSNMHSTLRLPKSLFSFDFLSRKESDKYLGEIRADFDKAVTTAGVKWDGSGASRVASAWLETPKLVPLMVSAEYETSGETKVVKLKVNKKDTSVIDLESSFHVTGVAMWNINFVLKSEFETIPSISLSSKHNLSDLNKMSHKSALEIIPKNEENFWLNRFNISARLLSLNVAVDNVEDIKGTLIFGDADFVLAGKIESMDGGYTSNIKISSNRFHELNFQGQYSSQGDTFSSNGKLTKRNGDTLIKLEMTSKQGREEKSGRFTIESEYIPKVEGFLGVGMTEKVNLTFYLKKGQENLVNFNSVGLIAPSSGSGHVKLTSSYFTSISHLQLDLNYDMASTGVNGNISFRDNRDIYSGAVESGWFEDKKNVKLTFLGGHTFTFEAKLEGLSHLVAHANYDGRSLGEISVSYRPEQGDFSFGKHGVYITFKDRLGETKNFNVLVGVDTRKIYLSVQTPFENWSDVVIDGQLISPLVGRGVKFILKREVESIEGSFEAKTSRKTGTLQLNSQLSVVGFSKLRQMLIDTAQAKNIKGLSAVEPQKFILQLVWGTTSVNVKIDTPLEFLNKVSLSGNWELKKPKKFITVKGEINEDQYELKAEFQNEDKLGGKLSLNAANHYKIEIDYDLGTNYEANVLVESPYDNWNVGGKIVIQQDTIQLDLKTPIRKYEEVSVKLLREFPSRQNGKYGVLWDINGKEDKVELSYEYDQGRVELRAITPIEPWTSVVVTIIYDTPFKRLQFHSQRGDGQEVKVNFEMESSGNMTILESPASSSILVAIESPIENFEDIKFSLVYNRRDLVHVGNLSISRNRGETEGKVDLKFQHLDPVALDISAYLASPFLSSKATAHASLLVDPNGESTISAHVQANGKRYEMFGLSQLTSTATKFEMRTSLPFLRQLKFGVKKGTSISLNGIWSGNNKQVEIHGDILCGGMRSSKVSFNVTTSVQLIGSFGFDAEVRSEEGGDMNAKLVFQNHEVRWLAKLNRNREGSERDDWRLQVNTPIVGYKHVVVSLNNVVVNSQRNVMTTVQLGKKELSLKMTYEPQMLNMVLSSELSHLPVQARIDSQWGNQLILKVSTSTGNNDYGTLFNFNLEGVKSGNLDFAMSSMNNLDTSLDWSFEGDVEEGEGLVNIRNAFIGSKSLRSSWKNDRWQHVQFDFWVKTGKDDGEKGVVIQYKVIPHELYGSIQASVNYTLSEGTKSIVFEGSLDETSSHLAFDSVLKTPFKDMETFEVKGHLTMKTTIGFNIEANVNHEKLVNGDLTLYITPLKSKLMLELDIPFITEPIELDTAYDIGGEGKTITILFKQDVYLIDVQLGITLPTSSRSIDVTLKAESTVPSLFLDVSGSLRMEYAVSEDGTHQISFNMNGNEVGEWKLLATMKATSDLSSKVVFTGPFPYMPSLTAEFNFLGNMRRGIKSDLTLILEGSEISANLNVDSSKWEGKYKCSAWSTLYVGDGKITFSPDQTNVDVRYKVGDDYSIRANGNVKIGSESKQGTGAITISYGSENEVPISFDIEMENHGSIRATGSSYEKEVKVEVNLKGYNGGSWLGHGKSLVKVEGNVFGGDVDYMLESEHYFRDGVYSLNVTTGEDNISFESYLGTGHNAKLYSKIKWFSEDEIVIDVKLMPSNVLVFLDVSPWLNIDLSGEYGSTDKSAFVNGILIFNGYRSIVNSSIIREENGSVCTATLDIPSIKQKFDVELRSVLISPQNMKGAVHFRVNEQEFHVSGSLKTQTFDSIGGERYIERVLQISNNISSIIKTNIGFELFLRKPIKSYSSVSIISTLTVNDDVSTISCGYEVPSADVTNTGLYLKFQSSYLPTEDSYEFFLKSFGNRMEKVEGKLNYKTTRFDILWDLIMPTSVISLSYSGRSEDGERLQLQLESLLNRNENLQLSINCHGWDTQYIFRTSLTRSASNVVGYLFMDAPRLLSSTNEYKITVMGNEDGSYTMEASAVRGRLVMEVVGDAAVTGNSANVVMKAMGSYGSHYVMIVGGREDVGQFGFEMTAESSSLLVGKRVNVRGNVTFDNSSVATVVQCRAMRNVHELSIRWRREEGGRHKFVLNIDSPSIDPAGFEADWASLEKSYEGRLVIHSFGEVHQSEFGLNLKNFEGKLHIISALLPSNEFNFHLRSIVESGRLDILGDIRIRGSHWRLEGLASFGSLQDMSFKLEMRTPFSFLDRVTFGIKSTKEEVYLEVYTPASYIPNVMFKLGGMEGLHNGIWYGLKPSLIISLPNGKYSAMGSVELPKYESAGVFHVLLEYAGKETYTVESYMELSPLKLFRLQMDDPVHLELKVVTPFKLLKEGKVYIEGEINSKRSGKLQINGGFNSHQAKFDGSFDNTNGNMQAVTRLITNIPGYEKSAFAFAIQTFHGIGNGKSFHVEFRKPDWENQFKLDADYRYSFESFTELEGEMNINMDSYMNVPPLHSHLKSGMKDGRYGGVIEADFGLHHPSIKVETERLESKITVFVEAKAGELDRYNLVNTFEMIPLQSEFSFREKMHWNGSQVLNMEAILSDDQQLFQGQIQMFTPWGPVNSNAVLTPITFITMNEALSFSQFVKNSNATFEVEFDGEKVIGLEVVSRDGMRIFEIHNPIRPIALSIAVEKTDWSALRMKAGFCWDLKVPERSSIGLDAYMYIKSTGLTLGGYIAGAKYGIVTGNFEHFLVSSRLAQNLAVRWTGFAGQSGNVGYAFNVTDKSTGFRKMVDYSFKLVAPSRTYLVNGGCAAVQDKYSTHNLAISWDAGRNPEKSLKLNVTMQKSTTWRTMAITNSLQVHHVSWNEPVAFSIERIFIHDNLRQVELKVKPRSEPSSHFVMSSGWENGDWSTLSGSLVQPSTNIDISLRYNITEASKSFFVKYMLFTGESKVLSGNLERSGSSQYFSLQSGDGNQPRTLCSLNSQVNSEEYSIRAILFNYQILTNIQRGLPYVDLTFYHDNAKLQIVGGLAHPREMIFRTTRSHFTKTINDVNVHVRLNSSTLLSARIHWRPELMDEIVGYDWLKGSKHFMNSVFPSIPQLSNDIRREVEGHWNMFSTPVKAFGIAFYDFSAVEVGQIVEELRTIGRAIKGLYETNTFYIKDAVDTVYASFTPLANTLKYAYKTVKSLCATVCNNLVYAGRWVSATILKYYGRLETHVMKAWDNVEGFIGKVWQRNAAWLQSVSEQVEEVIDVLIEAFEGRIEMLEEKLMAVGFIRKLIQLYRDYAAWLDELPIDDYVTAIENFFQIKVWDKLEELLGPYMEAIRNAMDGQYIKELLETPPIPYIRFVLRQTKNVLVRVWDFVEIEGKMKDLVRHTLKNLDGLMQRNFPAWELEWDIEKGVVEYDQSLSFIEWPDFTQYPRLQFHSQDTQEVNQIANFYYQVLDYIEHLRPIFDLRIRDILPPFGGTAMMAGDHHYYTFDKKYFRFAGDCSYVLVADLLHNGFSFIVNYASNREGDIYKKSYTIAIPDKSIEFDVADFKVTVNNRKIELPAKIDTVYMRRQETRLDIYDVRGYQITCSLSPSVCTFSTSGWYYGKLAGLLGTYDNEPLNDFKSADGQFISDIPSFTYSWRVGKERNQCRMKNYVKEEVNPVDVDNICYDLLANRNSPLRPCFNTVDTAVYMEMCKFDVSRNVNSASRPESACTSMSAYVTECQNNNVDVWMPPTCVRCKLMSGAALTTGENVTLERNGVQKPPSSSDIVILVEEQGCMDQLDITSAISKLETALRAEGITDNRYAYVGYGGQGIHYEAHIQTSSSSVWSHSTLFKVPDKQNVSGERKADLYSAIHFASTMTFRAGVSKKLIAITCGSEKCGDSVRYADTLTLLVENDFMLHMLTPKPFNWKGEKKQDDVQIYGFDLNGAYTSHHAKRGPLEPDLSLKKQLNLPKDLCTPLAVETNGTRFTTDNLSKKMIDVWSRRVAQTSHPSECQRCECVPDRNGGSRFMCHQCVSPTMWKFLEEWKSYQSQEVDDMFGIEMMETDPFLLPPH